MTIREVEWAPHAADSRLRAQRFVRRATLSVQAIAAAANAMAANLESCFDAPIEIRIVPPVLVAAREWELLREGRRCYNFRAEMRDAVLLVEEATARRMVGAAFGEDRVDDSLSRLESRVLERCINELVAGLHSLCGNAQASPDAACGTPSVYFELRLGPPVDAALGIALGAPKEAAEQHFLHAKLLEECLVECWVRLGSGNVDIFTIAGLAVGDVVPLETKVGAFATLNLGAEAIAAGEGGIYGDRAAFKVHELI